MAVRMNLLCMSALALGAWSALSVVAETPDNFTWRGPASGNWDDDGVWKPSSTTRTAPGIVGDRFDILNGETVTLSHDAAASTVVIRKGGALSLSGEDPVTFLLSGGAGHAVLRGGQVNWSTTRIGTDPLDTVNCVMLGSPVDVGLDQDGSPQTTYMRFNAKLSGGSESAPADLIINKGTWSWNKEYYCLLNAANDFRGDIYLNGAASGDNFEAGLYVGASGCPGKDSMLGNANNAVILNRTSGCPCKLILSSMESTGLRHRVAGNGNVSEESATTVLCLGDGFVADPGTAAAYQNLGFSASAAGIQIHPNAVFRFDVAAGACDTVAFDPKKTFSFTGRIELVPKGNIAVGTSFDLISVNKSAGTFAFDPSAVPTGWEFSVKGDSSSGWTVTATKAMVVPEVANGAVSKLGPTSAVLSGTVTSMGPFESGKLAFVYGQTDGGSDAGAWASRVESEVSMTAAGDGAIGITGLTVNCRYYYRAAFVSGTEIVLAPASASFVTVPESTPDVFDWRLGEAGWDDDGAWTNGIAYARQVPGYAGDTIRFSARDDLPGVVAQEQPRVSLNRDLTVGWIEVGNKVQDKGLVLDSATPVTLTLDNLGKGVEISQGWHGGSVAIGRSGQMTLCLNDALTVRNINLYSTTCRIDAKVTGGSAEHPRNILLVAEFDEYSHPSLELTNPANDFRGDLTTDWANKKMARFTIMVSGVAGENTDSVLGDPANKIILRNNGIVSLQPTDRAPSTFNREVRGKGSVSASYGLALGAQAVVSPGESDTAFSTITLDGATSFTDVPGTVYRVNVSATGSSSDVIDFSSTAQVSIQGGFEIVPDNPNVKIPVGMQWKIGRMAKILLTTGRLVSLSEAFKVFAVAEDGGWGIYAERTSAGLMLLVR